MLSRSTFFAACLGFSVLFFIGSPGFSRSILTTTSGEVVKGTISQPSLSFDTDSGKVIVSRASLQELRSDGEHLLVELKDGKSFVGDYVGELKISDGLIDRVYEQTQMESVRFDVFSSLDERFESCPIRGVLSMARYFASGKPKKLVTNQSQAIKCDGNYLSLLTLTPRGKAAPPYVKVGEEPRKGYRLGIRPEVKIKKGDDHYISLKFFLEQGDRLLGVASLSFHGDEGEVNRGKEAVLWYPNDIDPAGPTPTLRFQLMTVHEDIDRGKGSEYFWFTHYIH